MPRKQNASKRTEMEFIRLPGLFRKWELELIVEVGAQYHFESAGATTDGIELIAVYRREVDEEVPLVD